MRAVVAFSSLAILFAACSSFQSSSDLAPVDAGLADSEPDGGSNARDAEAPAAEAPDAKAPDAAPDGAVCPTACVEGRVCAKGSCVPGCAGGIVHVAPDGDDAKAGCSPTSAKKTIHGALAFARTALDTTVAIHACTGTYHEPRIILDVPVSLLGGYGCSSFQRPENYGFPTFGGGTTRLESDDAETIIVTGPDLGPSVTIDGLIVAGAATGDAPSTAILVRDHAKVTISNTKALGGRSAGALAFKARSFGLRVDSGAAPDLHHLAIDGGAGTSTIDSAASVGIQLELTSGPAHIHDSLIGGGSGAGTTVGSMAIRIGTTQALIGASAIEHNAINGGDGRVNAAERQYPVTGIQTLGGAVDILDNVVLAGTGLCGGGGDCVSVGISAFATGLQAGKIERNRVDGGTALSTPGGSIEHDALFVFGGADGTVVNNMIYLGHRTPSATTLEYGIAARSGTNRLVAHNTFGGMAGDNKFYIDAATAEKGMRVLNNLFLGTRSDTEVALSLRYCDGSTIKELRGSVFVGFDTAALAFWTGCAAPGVIDFHPDIRGLQERLEKTGGTVAMNNFRIAESCAGELAAACFASSCAASAFPSCVANAVAYDAPTSGFDDFKGAGWLPKNSGLLCAAAKTTVDVRAEVPVDLLSRARLLPVVGALEQPPTCP